MRFIYPILLLFFAGFSSYAQTKTIYVAPNGSDGNSGSIQSPFKTLEKALLSSKRWKGQNVAIKLRKGTYYLDQTVVLNAEDILPASLQLTAYKNELVTMSAGRKLRLNWLPYINGIYRAAVPAGIVFERLYVNDAPQIIARYPNYNDTSRVYHGTSPDAISPSRIKRWKNPVGGYVHALHAGEWGSFDYLITGFNTNGTLKMSGGWQNNRPSAMNKEYLFVENISEELDAPGEWYLDRSAHMLYYYPPKNVNLSSALVEVSNLKNSIELRGSVGHPVKNVTISKINFRHNERSFMDTREPLLRSDWSIYRGGAILFEGTENCKITDCSFVGLGGNAIMISNYNKKDTVRGCLVEHIGASAVCFVGDPKAVRSPLFRYEEWQPYDKIDKTPGPQTSNYPQECVVTDNLFHDLGEMEKQATGVQITISSSITVSHNSIYNTPRAGLNINDGCWGGHILAYNDVFNTVLETGDHGAFNSWGRDRYWAPDRNYMDSLVRVHPELILLDAQKQNVIHDNRFRCDHGWDIDLDDGSSNYHIYNNVCLNGGLKLREGFYRIVENNILINNTFHPHVWFSGSGDLFEHNIVMKSYLPVNIKDWGTKIDYNLFTDSESLMAVQNNGTDQHSVTGSPMFVDAKVGDYTIAANTVAFKVGFKNIPMDQFGVQKPALRALALNVPIPNILAEKPPTKLAENVSFLGGAIKSVENMAERSSFGLLSTKGAIIVNIGAENSLLAISGLRNNDVIVSVDKKEIIGANDLVNIILSLKAKRVVPVTFYRNQQPYTTTLKINN